MLVRSRTVTTAALAALVVVGLTACVPADDPVGDPTSEPSTSAPSTSAPSTSAPSTSATATPSATASETPSPADAAGLLIGPTSFTLVDDSGADLGTWEYRDGTGAIAALTEAFGSAPAESDDIPYEGYRSRAFSWPGFAFKDTEVYDAGGPEQKYPEPDFLLEASAPAVGDVAVSTLGGVSVGDAAADVRAEHPDSVSPDSLKYFSFDVTPVGTLDGVELTNGVGVNAEDEVTVSSIRAPFVNWGV